MPSHRPSHRPALRPSEWLGRSTATRVPLLLRGLAAALVLALLVTGCGGADDPPKTDDPSTSTDESDPEDAEDAEPAPDPGYQAAKIGQCYRMTGAQSRASVATGRLVSCAKEHTSVVAHVGYVPRAVTPKTPLTRRRALGARVCEPAYRRVVGGTLADRATSILTWTLFTPGQDQLERGARWIRCDVIARSGNQLVELPPGQPLLKQGVPEPLRVCQNAAGADVSCARPHSFRVVAVYRAAGAAYPDATAYTPTARSRCKELMGVFGGFWQPPSPQGWAAGDRFIRCQSPRPTAGQSAAP